MNLVVYIVLVSVYAVSLRLRKWIDRQQLKAAFENPRRARSLERLYGALAILNWVVILAVIGFTIYLTV